MLKHISTLLFLVLLSACMQNANAQGRFIPADTIYEPGTVSNTSTDGEVDLYIYYHNQSDTEQIIFWKFVSHTIPSDWKVGLCDNNNCFYNDASNPLYTQRPTLPIPAGDTIFFKTVFNPQCQSGSAEVKVYLHIKGDYDAPDTLTYKTDVVADPSCINAVTEVGAGSRIVAFPNPTNNNLFVKGMPYNTVCKVEVLDAAGRIVVADIKASGKENLTLNSSGLAPGLYFLHVSDAENQLLKVSSFSKQ